VAQADKSPTTIDLDTATRSRIIAEVSAVMIESGCSIWEAVTWRSKTGSMDFAELLAAANALGIGFTRGGQPYGLPMSVTPIRLRH